MCAGYPVTSAVTGLSAFVDGQLVGARPAARSSGVAGDVVRRAAVPSAKFVPLHGADGELGGGARIDVFAVRKIAVG
jgi:hypothetical protein